MAGGGGMTRPLEIAIVNNMPDAALAATNLQFSRLVRKGARGRVYRWRSYTLPGLPRGDEARRYLARGYEDIEALYRRGADALIVTGCEPRAPRLADEPYWPHITRLADWARNHTISTIWSCLAAHAAVLHLAGVARVPFAKKVSGVYRFARFETDWAVHDSDEVLVPHSRYNGLPREDLEGHGFHIGSSAAEVGVDMFWRVEPSLFVFLQGHPEYDADTLLRENRRDVIRFLDGQRTDYPAKPENFFSASTREKLEQLEIAIERRTETNANARLAEILANEQCVANWSDNAVKLFRDWLTTVAERAGDRRESA
jgi:homoserine O-succinyltransferase